jgi:hypothetical protein
MGMCIKHSNAFLDTSCSLENETIEVDLFRKKTDRNQCLMPESCHSNGTIKSTTYSLAIRIIRICTKTAKGTKGFRNLRYCSFKENILSLQSKELWTELNWSHTIKHLDN